MPREPYELEFQRVVYFGAKPPEWDDEQGDWREVMARLSLHPSSVQMYYITVVPDAYHGTYIAALAAQAGQPQYFLYNDKYYAATGLSWGDHTGWMVYQIREIQDCDPARVIPLFQHLMNEYVEPSRHTL